MRITYFTYVLRSTQGGRHDDALIKVTRDLIRAGQLLKIEVLDHVILGCATADRLKDYSWLRELGYCAL